MRKSCMLSVSALAAVLGLVGSALAGPCTGPDLVPSATTLAPSTAGSVIAGSASQDDTVLALPAPPFSLRFNGQSYTAGSVSTNGVLQLGPGSVTNSFNNTNLPSFAFSGPVIVPFWDDLITPTTGGVFTNTTGTAPDRSFEVRWQVAHISAAGDPFAFSIYFFENAATNPDFIIAYTPGVNALARGSDATIGVQASPSGPASVYSFLQTSVVPGLNLRAACAGQAFTYQGKLENAGVTPTGNFDLTFTYVNAAGAGLAAPISRAATPVNNGLFTVQLPLTVDNSGGDVFVRISVNGTVLAPDQPLGAAPAASFAYRAGEADSARFALTALSAAALNRGVSLVEANAIQLNTGTATAPNRLAFGALGNLVGTAESTDAVYFQRVNAPGGNNTDLRLYIGDDPGVAPGAGGDAFSIWSTNGTASGGTENFRFQTNGVALKPGGGSWTVLSDPRAKHDIAPLAGTLNKLLNLRGYSFVYNDDRVASGIARPGTQIGLMADEVAGVFPDWVSTDGTGTRFVTERATTALMVEALRDLRAEKDAAAAEATRQIDSLRAENAAMKARLERLERVIEGAGK